MSDCFGGRIVAVSSRCRRNVRKGTEGGGNKEEMLVEWMEGNGGMKT